MNLCLIDHLIVKTDFREARKPSFSLFYSTLLNKSFLNQSDTIKTYLPHENEPSFSQLHPIVSLVTFLKRAAFSDRKVHTKGS